MEVKRENKSFQESKIFFNPQEMPQSVTYIDPQNKNRILCYMTKTYVRFSFVKGMNFKPLSRLIPIWEFQAVLARIVMTPKKQKAIALFLYHENKNYQIPLVVSRNLEIIAYYWKLWAKFYHLPMFLENEYDKSISLIQADPIQQLFNAKIRKEKLDFTLKSQKKSLGVKVKFAHQTIFT